MYGWLMERIYSRYVQDSEDTLEYGWVFGITFFLVLFLSQTLYIWIFGEVGSVLAWIVLLVWSFIVSYVLLFGSGTAIFKRMKEFVDNFVQRKYLHKAQIALKSIPETRKYASIPSDMEEKKEQREEELMERLEKKAHAKGALISGDGLSFITDFGGGAEHVLDTVIERAKKEFPRFDGWVVLNKEQVITLLGEGPNTEMGDEKEEETEEVYLGDVDRKNHVLVPANLPTGDLQSKNATAAASFLQLLCEGDEQGLFIFVRKLRQGSEDDIRTFMRDTILMLDRVHEHRIDGAGYVDKKVLEHTRCFSNEEIEEIISILVGSVDHRYSVPEIGIKLSLIRALEYIKKARKN